MNRLVQFATIAAFAAPALAQSAEWGQCGGQGWTGPTTCVAGTTCVFSNPYYSQCLPGTAVPTVTPTETPTPTPTSTPTTTAKPSSSSTATGTGGAAPTAVIGAATGPGLNKYAQAAGLKYFGSATDNPELTDQPYIAILSNTNEFGQITPGNSMKWDATEPTQNTFTFSGGDAILNLAKGNGQILRAHNLVWYSQLPSWVTSGSWTNATLTAAMTNHISNVAGHYKGEVYCWDAVNEPFNDDGTFRTDVFYNTIGQSYIATALQAARKADPNAKLYINDYNIEGPGAKSTAMINLVTSLKAQGVPIDGIGVQGHLIVGELPSGIEQNLAAFAALGVEVAITELDIRMTLPSTPALLAQQQKDYQTVVAACKAVSACVGITIWDYTDKYSWVPATFSGQGAACPWDANLGIKAAYNGILAGF
ncbi:glycoside hydrolase family 10 protein [Sphaerobolus stellatus SS14]|uniref:Beta-xylanase n=1 Tax=Sphaerobolus stellatus (strain SS14) TaxID=990650 RepID=A0A0C9U1U3_SPHS4|nr:glycoside hydrolase family 10 protein [Sphaerobolus stellatus SS14]